MISFIAIIVYYGDWFRILESRCASCVWMWLTYVMWMIARLKDKDVEESKLPNEVELVFDWSDRIGSVDQWIDWASLIFSWLFLESACINPAVDRPSSERRWRWLWMGDKYFFHNWLKNKTDHDKWMLDCYTTAMTTWRWKWGQWRRLLLHLPCCQKEPCFFRSLFFSYLSSGAWKQDAVLHNY